MHIKSSWGEKSYNKITTKTSRSMEGKSMKPFAYFCPTSLKNALDLLKEYKGQGEILNGGTDLIVRLREGHSMPKAVIDIKGIQELKQIEVKGDTLFVGACVLLNELGTHPFVKERVPFLSEAALSVGSKQVRNRATCVGNLCNASPLADTATPLLALNAQVHIYGQEGVRTVPLSDFFVFVRKTILSETDIVTQISFEAPKDGKGVFTKIARRKEVDLSTVCGTVIKAEDGYRISMGAVAPTPLRLKETETYLNEAKVLNEDVINKACKIGRGEVSPIGDIRASKNYREDMVEVILSRSLSTWMNGGTIS